MSIETRTYAKGTELTQQFPWGWYRGGKAMCSDGQVRNLVRLSETPDSFFSTPAAVSVKGKTVSGFISLTGSYGEEVVQFTASSTGRNGHLLA